MDNRYFDNDHAAEDADTVHDLAGQENANIFSRPIMERFRVGMMFDSNEDLGASIASIATPYGLAIRRHGKSFVCNQSDSRATSENSDSNRERSHRRACSGLFRSNSITQRERRLGYEGVQAEMNRRSEVIYITAIYPAHGNECL